MPTLMFSYFLGMFFFTIFYVSVLFGRFLKVGLYIEVGHHRKQSLSDFKAVINNPLLFF